MKLVIYEQNVDMVSILAICTEETLKQCVVKLSEEFKTTIEKGNPNSSVWMLPADIGVMINQSNPSQWYFYQIKVGCQIVTKMNAEGLPLDKEKRENIYQQFTIQEVTDSFVLL